MSALLASELRRALSRRAVWLLLAVCSAGILIGSITTFAKSHKASGTYINFVQDAQQRQQQFDQCMQGSDDGAQFDKCRSEFGGPLGVRDPRFLLTSLPGILKGTTVPWVIISWLIGASLIGAEWRANTITTALTWEPRRIRLFLAKAIVAVALAVAFTIVLQVLLSLLLTPAALLRGSTAGFGGTTMRAIAGVVLRGSLLAGVGAAIGFAIGMTGRNTAAALGIGFIYLAVIEGGIVGGLFAKLRPWLLVGNSVVLVNGSATGGISGRGVAGAAVLLSLYAAGALALAASIFRNRDVT